MFHTEITEDAEEAVIKKLCELRVLCVIILGEVEIVKTSVI